MAISMMECGSMTPNTETANFMSKKPNRSMKAGLLITKWKVLESNTTLRAYSSERGSSKTTNLKAILTIISENEYFYYLYITYTELSFFNSFALSSNRNYFLLQTKLTSINLNSLQPLKHFKSLGSKNHFSLK